jgi:hypothetical protein
MNSIAKTNILPCKKLNIPRDGNCMFDAIIWSLYHHPCGDLRTKARCVERTIEALRKNITLNQDFINCYTELYHTLNDFEIHNLREMQNPGSKNYSLDTYSQEVLNWFINTRSDKRNVSDFIKYVSNRVSNTTEYGTQCELNVFINLLLAKNIILNVIKILPNIAVPKLNDFGTCKSPIITILYNGTNHYDALVYAKAKTFFGGVRQIITKRKKNIKRSTRRMSS